MRGVLLLTIVVCLAGAGGAAAKGPRVARICGASGCIRVTDEEAISAALPYNSSPFELVSTPRPAPYFTMVTSGHGGLDAGSYIYVPSRGVVHIADHVSSPYWRAIPKAARSAFAALVRDVRPFPASRRWP